MHNKLSRRHCIITSILCFIAFALSSWAIKKVNWKLLVTARENQDPEVPFCFLSDISYHRFRPLLLPFCSHHQSHRALQNVSKIGGNVSSRSWSATKHGRLVPIRIFCSLVANAKGGYSEKGSSRVNGTWHGAARKRSATYRRQALRELRICHQGNLREAPAVAHLRILYGAGNE